MLIPRITLVTPTFKRDFERFCLQRESIERCGIDLPHVAIVHSEDVPLFRDMPYQRNLVIVPTSEVVGRTIDRRRQVWRISRRDYRYWITPSGVHGWQAQQLAKLAAPRVVTTDGLIYIDSDVFFVDRLVDGDFFAPDGRLHLYETTDDLDVEMAEWYAHSLRFFGVKETGIPPRRYTHVPMAMHRNVLLDMQGEIEKRHGIDWMEAIIRGDRLMEYTVYGTYARHIDGLKRVAPALPSLCIYYWWAQQSQAIQDDLIERVTNSDAKLVLINSNLGKPVSFYRELASAAWSAKRPGMEARAVSSQGR